MGLKTNALTLGLLLTAIAPFGAASPDGLANSTGDRAELCLQEIELTQATFSAFGDSVPAAVVAAELPDLYAACYDPLPEGDLEGLVDLVEPEQVCAGGGSTIMGWANFVTVGAQQFHVQNSPASSHWKFYEQGSGDDHEYLAEGYTRSTLDNIEASVVENDVGYHYDVWYWDFASIPMGGTVSWEAHCLAGVVTSTYISASGAPLGISVLRDAGVDMKMMDPFSVQSNGRTCLVPC